jgi:hypothetical protein
MGHLDPDAVKNRQAVVLRPLDGRMIQQVLHEIGVMDPEGRETLDGLPIDAKDGCVIARWLVGSFRNRAAEEFAIRLHQKTDCLIADREHGRLIDPGELEGLAKRKVSESA